MFFGAIQYWLSVGLVSFVFHCKEIVCGFQVGPKFGYKFGIFGKCSKQAFGKG